MGHQHKSLYKLLWIHFKLYLSTRSPINSEEGRWSRSRSWSRRTPRCQTWWLFTKKVEKDAIQGLKQGWGHSQGDGGQDVTGPMTPQKEEQPERRKPGRKTEGTAPTHPTLGDQDHRVLLSTVLQPGIRYGTGKHSLVGLSIHPTPWSYPIS